MSRSSSVGIATELLAGRLGFRTPVGATDFSFLPNVQTDPGTHPACYSMDTGFLPGDETTET